MKAESFWGQTLFEGVGVTNALTLYFFHKLVMRKVVFVIVCTVFAVVSVNAQWNPVKTGSLSWLHTINFPSKNIGWVGGSNGTLLKTTDGGDTWAKQPDFTKDTIRQIYFTNEKNGWMLVHRDMYSLGMRHASYLMRTTNGGETWDTVELPTARAQRIMHLFFSPNGFVLAIGEMGALLGVKDDGKEWKKFSLPVANLMSDGVFLNSMSGVVVGGGGNILFTQDAGVSWNPATVVGNAPSVFNALSFYEGKVGLAVGAQGAVFQTLNGGKLWRSISPSTVEKLNDVLLTNSSTGYAVGDKGTIMATRSGGNSWAKEVSGTRHRLERIVANGGDLWIVGFGGLILRKSAAGKFSE